MPQQFQNASTLQIEGVENFNRLLEKLRKDINDPKMRRRILRQAGKPVAEAGQRIAPKQKLGRYRNKKVGSIRYGTPKIIGALRAPNNKGRRIATYLRGNLAGAIRVLRLRRAFSAIIGPVISKRGKGGSGQVFGPGTGKFDGYYAQMVFGSARAFGNRVMARALQEAKGASITVISRGITRVLKKEGKKNGFIVK